MSNPFALPGRFLKGNLHTHSTLSDGHRSPEEVCDYYARNGYDFFSLTEHFQERYMWPVADTRAFHREGFITIPGAELHPPMHRMQHGEPWHIVAVGLPYDFAPSHDGETGPQIAQRALDAGAWVMAAHPQWFAMSEQDMLDLSHVHAIEIFNASAADDNDAAESTYMWDLMLARGMRFSACATDDAHFLLNTRDRGAGWAMVKSEANTPESILAALKAGAYYSSSGPEIHDIAIEGNSVHVRCSPANRIFLIGGPAKYRQVGEQGITEATFSLDNWKSPFFRIVVRDDHGKKAWSNPIWLDSLGR